MTPSDPSQLTAQAKSSYEAGEYEQAADLFRGAVEMYTSSGDVLSAAEAKNNFSVALLQAGKPREALEAALGTDETFANAGDVVRQAMALGNMAAAYEELKQFDQAFELYSRSSELLKQTGEKDLRSYVLQRLSQLQLRRGDRLEAVATMQTALDSREKLGIKDRMVKGLLNKVSRMMGPK